MPRIDTLLRTWYQLKLPVACLVDGPYPGVSPEVRTERSREIMKARDAAPKRSPEKIRRALEAALSEEPAPALHEIARRLGYRTTTRVRNADSELCRQIVLRHRKSGRSHWWRRRGAKPICELSRIRKVLEEHLASDGPYPRWTVLPQILAMRLMAPFGRNSRSCVKRSPRGSRNRRGCEWR